MATNYTKISDDEDLIKKSKLCLDKCMDILKVIYDGKINCLHMNPGAAGNQGWHTVRTIIRFNIDGKEIKNCEVIELGKRGTQ